jgi:hypothetical protein
MAIGIDQSEHRSRAGESQSLFRDVNNRIKSLNELRSGWSTISEWVCECANEHCTERIEMTVDEYAELRSNPTHFAVVADDSHVVGDAERVVARHERYWVVEKLGDAAGSSARDSRVP